MDSFDIIIVGAGSAGCVLADRLSADGKRRVLVLEAGGSDRGFWIRTPIGYGKTFFDERVNWKYSTEPEETLDGRAGYWPRGKVLGGSSSINAMVYIRGMPRDFDDWRLAGNPGWGWSDVKPVFESFERPASPETPEEQDGKVWVTDVTEECHPIRRNFLDAAAELGLPLAPERGPMDTEGVGTYRISTRAGRRCSAADAFLHPALQRGNIELRTNALVTRLLFENGRASGVEYEIGGTRHTVQAADQVILAAGAINSPKILHLSGIGPGRVLQDMNIAPVHENDAVGAGLQDHLGTVFNYRSTVPTLNGVLGSWTGRVGVGIQYLATRKGPLSLSINQNGGLVRSDPSLLHPDTQLYFTPLTYSVTYENKRPLTKTDPHPGFALSFNPCRPTSRGSIEIASPDPHAPPLIRPNSLSTAYDEDNVVAATKLLARMQRTTALQSLIAAPPASDPTAMDEEAMLADFRARASTVFHACGTCRMGPSEADSVVDSSLRVHGVDGLRVVDASIFPNVTSANTNAPSIMVAARAADIILGRI